MAEALTARLLGRPRFTSGGTPVECASKKAVALFVFVLLSGKPHSRRELATLFWGARDGEAARSSLRAALHRLPPPMAQCLDIGRETVARAAGAAPSVDVERFEALARDDALEALERAAALYDDELLRDFEADATPEFDDWLHAERVRLAQLAQNVFDRVIAQRVRRARDQASRATAEREAALATGRRWVTLMPGIEAAHRWLMRIYLDMGMREGALEQYELCSRFLAVAHGRAPSPEARALHDEALAGGAPRATVAADEDRRETATHASPAREAAPTTSFVGRLEELAELDGLLADPACRLVTLHGLGGTGKTRLARALVSQVAGRFERGVAWVGLEAAHSPGVLPDAIAAALGRQLPAQGDRAAALAAMLVNQQRLIVLDNFETLLAARAEHDVDALEVLVRILEAAPGVRILVTSREALGLQEEWIYELRGLPFPSDDASGAAAAAAPAVDLFAQRARQAYLGFSLQAELPHVRRICRLVEGLPLGLELAAAWVRTVPCGEIAGAVEREAAALASRHRNRPARQQSLDAVVAYSWNLLGADQQAALAALGIFVGGFTREAAERIADAPLRTLSALVDKALVRRRAEGRYDLHELVRQFAAARLAQVRTRRASVLRRHIEFFAAAVMEMYTDSRGPLEVAATARFNAELPNVLASWRHAFEEGRRDVLERVAAPLIALLHTRGYVRDALAAGERAASLLDGSWRDEATAAIRMQWGRAAITGGRPSIAQRELDAALALARSTGKPELVLRGVYYRGTLAYQQGDVELAQRLGEEAVALADSSADPEARCIAHNLCGTVANMTAQFDVAEDHLRLALTAARENAAPSMVAGMLCSLAVPLYYRGEFAEAQALTREAAATFEALGRMPTAGLLRGNLAGQLLASGDSAAAKTEALISIRMTRDAGDDDALSASLATLADVLLATGELHGARAALDEALALARAMQRPLIITECLFLLATIALREHRHEESLEHLRALRATLHKDRLAVRVPMLILGVADWAATGARANLRLAQRWLDALARLPDIDRSLALKARASLDALGDDANARGGEVSLADLEREVGEFLDRL